MSDIPRAPGAMGMMAASLAEQRRKATATAKGKIEKVFADEPAAKPVSLVSDSIPAPSPAVVAAPAPAPAAATPVSTPRIKAEQADDAIFMLDPNDIVPWELADRPDQEFGDLEEITESIRAHGQETPALVRPIPGQKGKYELIYGRRRWTVVKDLGLKLKTFIKTLDDKSAFQKMFLENSSRKDLSAWARARSYKKAIEKGLYPSESALAAHLGIHRGSLNNIMAFNRIPDEIVEAVGQGMSKIGIHTAKAIISACDDPENVARIVSLADKLAAGGVGPETITSAVQKAKQPRQRDTKIISDATGKKLFSLRQTGRGMTEVMFYQEAVKQQTEEELINKIKGLFTK